MNLFELLTQYAQEKRVPVHANSATPNLGYSLSLFHSSLVESGLKYDESEGKPHVCASAEELDSNCLSHFVVAYLPFNSITDKSEVNSILFEVFSFFHWMKKSNLPYGLENIDTGKLIKVLHSTQARCLRLSHLLDDESGRILKDPPKITQTINDVFTVEKIDHNLVFLRGINQGEVAHLRLPSHILPLVELNDHLDLVLGDTSGNWVVLEAGQVYPSYL